MKLKRQRITKSRKSRLEQCKSVSSVNVQTHVHAHPPTLVCAVFNLNRVVPTTHAENGDFTRDLFPFPSSETSDLVSDTLYGLDGDENGPLDFSQIRTTKNFAAKREKHHNSVNSKKCTWKAAFLPCHILQFLLQSIF